MVLRPLVIAASLAGAFGALAACGSFASTDAPPAGEGGAPDDSAVGADGSTPTDDSANPDAPAPSWFELAHGMIDLAGITATETTVYFTERTPGNVHSIALAGNGGDQVLRMTGGAPSGIVVGGDQLFWVQYGQDRITRMPLAGGAGGVSFTPTPGKRSFGIVAAADRIVTVAVESNDIGEVQQYLFDFTVESSVGSLANPFDVSVTGSDIFWTESSAGVIKKGHVGDGSSATIASDESDCESIASDGSGVYWSRPSAGLVRALPTSTAVATTVSIDETGAHSLAADGAALYWITADGRLRKQAHAAGSLPVTLAAGFAAVPDAGRLQTLAVTSTYVVWLTNDGKVLRSAK
ncbi:MAG: putative serine/threonine-protein kinase pknH [Labilithrix sp.]|nr:putative serine/threonine-protein kinase pknH [Labilithrix sp.]